LTSRDTALELLVTRALDKDDQKLLALMTKRVGVTLRLQRVNAVVRSSSGPGQYRIWEIAR
jgi:Arc/MetJ family transcription regulator